MRRIRSRITACPIARIQLCQAWSAMHFGEPIVGACKKDARCDREDTAKRNKAAENPQIKAFATAYLTSYKTAHWESVKRSQEEHAQVISSIWIANTIWKAFVNTIVASINYITRYITWLAHGGGLLLRNERNVASFNFLPSNQHPPPSVRTLPSERHSYILTRLHRYWLIQWRIQADSAIFVFIRTKKSPQMSRWMEALDFYFT